MDYKTTYTYFFKATQNRLSNVLQSYLKKSKKADRPFSYAINQVDQYILEQIELLEKSWNYDKLRPIIKLIGLRNRFYDKHALSRILSNEVRDEFEKLKTNTNYKYFLSQLAQMEAIQEGYLNYIDNRNYFELCYKSNDLAKINFLKIEGGYTGLDDYYEKGKEIYKWNIDSDPESTSNRNKSKVNNNLNNSLTDDEKIIIIQFMYETKVPLNRLLKASEFYRLLFLTDGLFDNKIITSKPSDQAVYRKLGKHVDIARKTERDTIENLIEKLQQLKVNSIIPELRKLLVKTI